MRIYLNNNESGYLALMDEVKRVPQMTTEEEYAAFLEKIGTSKLFSLQETLPRSIGTFPSLSPSIQS